MQKSRISKEEALSFLLTHLVVEHAREIKLDQLTLFRLTRLAQEAVNKIDAEDDIIPHEVIETVAVEYLKGDR